MPDAIITSTESTFGTISGTFLETGATIQGTITGIVAGTLDGSVGVPGVGVPTGGTAGQVLAKIDGTNYNTEWVDQSGGVTSVVAPLSLTDGTLSIDESVWIEAPAVAATDGQIPAWDAATSRPVWIDNSARSLFLVGVNKSGSTIPKGAAVYVSGGQGGTPIISLAQANAESTSSQTIGVTTQAIANNAQGNVVVGGAAMKLDTSAYADGQILYLSPTVAGGFVTSLPTQPYHGVVIGYVTRSNNSNGVIEVAIQNYQELRELSDVLIGVKADGDLLAYESATGLWKNKTAAALGLATQSFVTGQGYITSAALAPYLLSSTAASTYQTLSGMSAYLTTSAAAAGYYPLTGNPSNFLTSAALAGYATESWVTGQGYLTSAALTPYLLIADAEASFYPLTGNPSNFIDASALTGYATQSWVTSQGYITSAALTPYLTTSLALSTFQTISGMSAYATLASPALTGNPTAPTPATADNDTSIATTAFVKAQGYLTSAPVTSVAGRTGAVTLSTSDISGLGTMATQNASAVVITGGLITGGLTGPLTLPSGQSITFQGDSTTQTTAYPGPSGFLLKADNLSGLANTSTARTNLGLGTMATATAADYSTKAVADTLYYPLSSNPAAYLTSASLSGYATESFVTSQGYITSSALTPYLTSAAAASTYQTIAGMSSYLTTSAAASTYLTQSNAATTYYPLSSNPAGYLTSAPVTSVAGRTGAITLSTSDISGLGTAATFADTAFLKTANNLSDLASASTARTNLGLGTMATETASNYALLASPALTGTPTAPTATVGTNTTQIATTAFVLANAGSTTFATNAQVVTGTSTTTALNPGHAGFLKADPRLRQLGPCNGTAISGSGAVTGGSGQTYSREMYLGSLATGRAAWSYGILGAGASIMTSKADRRQIDFSKKIWVAGSASPGIISGGTSYVGDANTVARVSFGGYATNMAGDMVQKGIGWKKVGGVSSVVQLSVHNGTTLTNVSSSVTVAADAMIDWVIYSDGTGNVTLYINGTQAATTSAGPTGLGTVNSNAYVEQVEAATTPSVRHAMHCNSGWIYLAD